MKIALATDHAGFNLKEELKSFLINSGFEVKDLGAKSFNPNDDYNDFVKPACLSVADKQSDYAIIFGKSGQGEAMVANRIKGIRAIVFYGNPENSSNQFEIISLGKRHNNANVLSFGAGFVDKLTAIEALKVFLNTEFESEEKHVRRINKIDNEE